MQLPAEEEEEEDEVKIRAGMIALIRTLMACASLQATKTLYLSPSTPTGDYPGLYNGSLNDGTTRNVQLYCDDSADGAPIGASCSVGITR